MKENECFWDKKEAKTLFQRLLFYNILIEKPRMKHPNNINLLYELAFHEEVSVVKKSKAFKGYARSYKI